MAGYVPDFEMFKRNNKENDINGRSTSLLTEIVKALDDLLSSVNPHLKSNENLHSNVPSPTETRKCKSDDDASKKRQNSEFSSRSENLSLHEHNMIPDILNVLDELLGMAQNYEREAKEMYSLHNKNDENVQNKQEDNAVNMKNMQLSSCEMSDALPQEAKQDSNVSESAFQLDISKFVTPSEVIARTVSEYSVESNRINIDPNSSHKEANILSIDQVDIITYDDLYDRNKVLTHYFLLSPQYDVKNSALSENNSELSCNNINTLPNSDLSFPPLDIRISVTSSSISSSPLPKIGVSISSTIFDIPIQDLDLPRNEKSAMSGNHKIDTCNCCALLPKCTDTNVDISECNIALPQNPSIILSQVYSSESLLEMRQVCNQHNSCSNMNCLPTWNKINILPCECLRNTKSFPNYTKREYTPTCNTPSSGNNTEDLSIAKEHEQRHVGLLDIPVEILTLIFRRYFTFLEISSMITTCRLFAYISSYVLKTGLSNLKKIIAEKKQTLIILLNCPKNIIHECHGTIQRNKLRLFREYNILEILHSEYTLLKAVTENYFQDEVNCYTGAYILDEFHRILSMITEGNITESCSKPLIDFRATNSLTEFNSRFITCCENRNLVTSSGRFVEYGIRIFNILDSCINADSHLIVTHTDCTSHIVAQYTLKNCTLPSLPSEFRDNITVSVFENWLKEFRIAIQNYNLYSIQQREMQLNISAAVQGYLSCPALTFPIFQLEPWRRQQKTKFRNTHTGEDNIRYVIETRVLDTPRLAHTKRTTQTVTRLHIELECANSEAPYVIRELLPPTVDPEDDQLVSPGSFSIEVEMDTFPETSGDKPFQL